MKWKLSQRTTGHPMGLNGEKIAYRKPWFLEVYQNIPFDAAEDGSSLITRLPINFENCMRLVSETYKHP